jgi:RNA polymerase sigma factor for flagellar operon FliA
MVRIVRWDHFGRVGLRNLSVRVTIICVTRSDSVTSTDADAASHHPDVLAAEHVALVAHLVRELSARIPATVDRDDLRSAGLVALVAAARGFDASLGVPFTAYATTRIRGALVDELRSVDWASRSVRRRSREIEATRQRLATAMGQFPDDAAVARSLGLTAQEVSRTDADVARASVLSLHGTGEELAEVIPATMPAPEAVVEGAERLEYLADAIAELPERLQVVVRGYFLEELPMADIAAELGVTESRVSQLRAQALVLLREALGRALEPEMLLGPEPEGVAARRRRTYADTVAARHASRRPVPPRFRLQTA